MAGKIFVNYRRGDARDGAARLRDKLAATLGDADVFMDVDNLLAGERFDLKLQEALASAGMFLAVIGAHSMAEGLLEARAASGERDFVREEIAAALTTSMPVIPVTMDRAPLPKPASLPEDIRDLVLYHKHNIAYESFGRDVAALTGASNASPRAGRAKSAARSRSASRANRRRRKPRSGRRSSRGRRAMRPGWRGSAKRPKPPGSPMRRGGRTRRPSARKKRNRRRRGAAHGRRRTRRAVRARLGSR